MLAGKTLLQAGNTCEHGAHCRFRRAVCAVVNFYGDADFGARDRCAKHTLCAGFDDERPATRSQGASAPPIGTGHHKRFIYHRFKDSLGRLRSFLRQHFVVRKPRKSQRQRMKANAHHGDAAAVKPLRDIIKAGIAKGRQDVEHRRLHRVSSFDVPACRQTQVLGRA